MGYAISIQRAEATPEDLGGETFEIEILYSVSAVDTSHVQLDAAGLSKLAD